MQSCINSAMQVAASSYGLILLLYIVTFFFLSKQLQYLLQDLIRALDHGSVVGLAKGRRRRRHRVEAEAARLRFWKVKIHKCLTLSTSRIFGALYQYLSESTENHPEKCMKFSFLYVLTESVHKNFYAVEFLRFV